MPMYMDRHETVDGTPHEIAELHLKDVDIQGKYGVRYVTYWVDYDAKRAFCLVDAPSIDQAVAVHREAHGAIPNAVIEVNQQAVEQFMGSLADNPVTGDPASTDQQPALRTILFSDMEESTALTQRLGDAAMMEVLRVHNQVLRDALSACSGTEVKHTGDGIMASFAAASRGVECAVAAQRAYAAHNERDALRPLQVRIGLTAGEPVMEHHDLFGAAVQLAKRICDEAQPGQILVANVVRELCIGKDVLFADMGDRLLKGFESPVRLCEVRWRGG
ncbi:MAG: nickel-binding protein [Dehalococcoidia bacterium]